VRRGVPRGLGGLTDVVSAPEWACAAGLLLYGRTAAAASSKSRQKAGAGLIAKVKSSLKNLFPSSTAL
jgi:cell division ATPase FtsA